MAALIGSAHLAERHFPLKLIIDILTGAIARLGRIAAGIARSTATSTRGRLSRRGHHIGVITGILRVFRFLVLSLGIEQIEVFELVAGRDERLGGLLLAHTDNDHAAFAQTGDESREIGIGTDDGESVDRSRIQDVHRVDDHRGVGGILAIRVAVLLHGNDRMVEQATLPARQSRTRPIAIDALVRRNARVGNLIEDYLDVLLANVVGIDQDGESQLGSRLKHLVLSGYSHAETPLAHGRAGSDFSRER